MYELNNNLVFLFAQATVFFPDYYVLDKHTCLIQNVKFL